MSVAGLLVVRGGHPQRIALGLVVVDPELRMLLDQQIGDALHGGQRLPLVEVQGGHAAVVPVALEVDSIARQHDRTCLRQPHQQRLMTRRVTGCRKNRDAAVTEYVLVAVEFRDWMVGRRVTRTPLSAPAAQCRQPPRDALVTQTAWRMAQSSWPSFVVILVAMKKHRDYS